MSEEASRRSRVTITLGRSGQVRFFIHRTSIDWFIGIRIDCRKCLQVVSRDLELEDELPPRVGTKRSVKERLGNQLEDSSLSVAVTKRSFLFSFTKVRPLLWVHGAGNNETLNGKCFLFFVVLCRQRGEASFSGNGIDIYMYI